MKNHDVVLNVEGTKASVGYNMQIAVPDSEPQHLIRELSPLGEDDLIIFIARFKDAPESFHGPNIVGGNLESLGMVLTALFRILITHMDVSPIVLISACAECIAYALKEEKDEEV